MLRRAMWVLGALFYVLLWALALNGATGFIPFLVVPVVLALLVYLGLALNRFLGTTPRRPRFEERDDADP
jgi:hypothetical protein